jgi:pyruvate dehydrogenase E2 component (dihydrolipoamide acetyltransferase)
MAEVIKMPKMSDTMTEGVIVAWHKKVGDQVKSGDILAEVETDKATMELENFVKGTLLHIGIEVGKAVPVDSIIAIVGQAGEDISALLVNTESNTAPAASETVIEKQVSAPSVTTVSNENIHDSRLKASPLAKKLAEEKGVNLSNIHGSGENGRIIKRDIETFQIPATTGATISNVGIESFEEVQLSQMRKTIARRLSESKFSAPHFYLTMEIGMDEAVAARKRINEFADTKISINDIVIKAVGAALRKNPKVNASWMGDKIRINHHIHIGVAMAVDEGLIVPVIRFADQKSLSQISSEVKIYSEKAKSKKLQPEEFSGNTFTISNLGMYGIEEFTAIINTPDSCILAVGAVKEVPVVKNGAVVPGNIMKVTLSCDHRSVDGAVGSAFLQSLKQYLEDPIKILV